MNPSQEEADLCVALEHLHSGRSVAFEQLDSVIEASTRPNNPLVSVR